MYKGVCTSNSTAFGQYGGAMLMVGVSPFKPCYNVCCAFYLLFRSLQCLRIWFPIQTIIHDFNARTFVCPISNVNMWRDAVSQEAIVTLGPTS